MFKFYIQVYITIYARVCREGHTLGTFYARKLKFFMLLFQTKTFDSVLELSLRHTLG